MAVVAYKHEVAAEINGKVFKMFVISLETISKTRLFEAVKEIFPNTSVGEYRRQTSAVESKTDLTTFCFLTNSNTIATPEDFKKVWSYLAKGCPLAVSWYFES